MAFAGLYGDLPSAKDQPSDDADKEKKKEGWAGSGLFAPTNLGGKRQGEGSGRRLHLQPASGGPVPASPLAAPAHLAALRCCSSLQLPWHLRRCCERLPVAAGAEEGVRGRHQ
jgi:hypothetical protein